ncbi:NERD domain-containing protein [Lysinibacillus sp. M3]|uniref:NERD domain-containing protein n=1 Tax=Lysinibacillus zambalensis TaxID=3160866 RepID=A0ABV1N231_9BACI
MELNLIYIGVMVLLSIIAITFFIKYKNAIKKNESTIKICEEQINLSNKEVTATVVETEKKYDEKLRIEIKVKEEQFNQKLDEKKKEIQKINAEKEDEINKIGEYVKSLEKYSRNRGEVITHEILDGLKESLINSQAIQKEDMMIMGNVFIPYIKDKKLMSRQIDHLILSQSGIFIIETKFWKGKIIHGVSKNNAGDLSIIVNNIFPDNKEDREETLIFEPLKKNDDNNREFKVISYDNPVNQVRNTASKLNEYINQKLNINKGVRTIVYFGYPSDEKNFVKNYSLKSGENDRFATIICTDSNDLCTNMSGLVTGNEKKYSLDELKKIEILLNEFNRIV